jgi:hypothetical protein
MKWFRQQKAVRFLWLVMALHIFNVSIDSVDLLPAHLPEDLSINDTESFVELVLEDFLGIKGAIAEHDEPESEESENIALKKLFAPPQPKVRLALVSTLPAHYSAPIFAEYQNPFVASVYTELISPPPQV